MTFVFWLVVYIYLLYAWDAWRRDVARRRGEDAIRLLMETLDESRH